MVVVVVVVRGVGWRVVVREWQGVVGWGEVAHWSTWWSEPID